MILLLQEVFVKHNVRAVALHGFFSFDFTSARSADFTSARGGCQTQCNSSSGGWLGAATCHRSAVFWKE